MTDASSLLDFEAFFDVLTLYIFECFRQLSSRMVLKPVGSRASAETQARILKSLPQEHLEMTGFDDDFAPIEPKQPFYMSYESSRGLSELPHDYDYSQHMREMGGIGGHYEPAAGMKEYDPEKDPRNKAYKETDIKNEKKSQATGSAEAKQTSCTEAKKTNEVTEKPSNPTKLVNPAAVNDEKTRVELGMYDGGREVMATHDFLTALDSDNDLEEYEEIADDFIFAAQDDNEEEVEEQEGGDAKVPAGETEEGENTEWLEEEEGEREDGVYEDEFDPEVIARKKKLLDEHFAALMGQYDDEGMGELEEEELEGGLNFEQFEGMLDREMADKERKKKIFKGDLEQNKEMLKKFILAGNARMLAEEKPMEVIDKELMAMCRDPRPKPKWDVESVISTLSNQSNHPSLILEPRRNQKPQKQRRRRGEGEGEGDEDEDEDLEEIDEEDVVNLGEKRTKKESKAEKQARKAAAKARAKEARLRKKGTRGQFRQMKKEHVQNVVSNRTANPAGLKL